MNFNKDFSLGGKLIKVRQDEYKHAYYLKNDGIEREITTVPELEVNESCQVVGDLLTINVCISVKSNIDVESLYMRTGIDCYMEKYPEWNDVFFPTMLKCEPTHFIGYLSSPNGDIICLSCDKKLDAWTIDYNRAIYGEENHVGHRIYSFCLHFFNCQKEKFEKGQTKRLFKGEKFNYQIKMTLLDSLDKVYDFWQQTTGMAIIESQKWTLEQGDKIDIKTDGYLEIISPSGQAVNNGETLNEIGLYSLTSKLNDKITTANVFVRYSLDKYLCFAGECAFTYPQRPSTHAETYYGYFSAFNYARHGGDKEFLTKTEEDFKRFCSVMEDESGKLCQKAEPDRLQNISTMISIFVVAFRATKNKYYVEKAISYAKFLMSKQAEGGQFLGWGHVHYTCVIYPAKSLLELYDLLVELGEYKDDCELVFLSASRAIEDLSIRMDNIETEGQQTFEDGMISCEALQLAMLALRDEKNKEKYTECAKKLMQKHQCLEQRLVFDARMRGCTLRFWESMYDVLINCNMINSPHGWTAWKTYATFYLYLLTGDKEYLLDTFNTLGAELQCFDIKNNQLNWAFIADSIITASVFTCEQDKPTLTPKVFGQCYLPMISNKWLSDANSVCYGYAFPDIGITEGFYKGGCCDNDVHEHIKCMEEIGLNAFVHEQADGEPLTFNCKIEENKLRLESKYLKKLYYFALTEKDIVFDNKTIKIKVGLNSYNLNQH